jgi:hypothetical protein
MPTEYPKNPRGRKHISDYDNIGWGLPLGVLALLLVAGALFFSSAGPDRTRTAETHRTVPDATKSAPAPKTQPPAAAVR